MNRLESVFNSVSVFWNTCIHRYIVQENIFVQIEFVSFIDTHYNILLYDEILIAKHINGLKFIGNLEYIKGNWLKIFH